LQVENGSQIRGKRDTGNHFTEEILAQAMCQAHATETNLYGRVYAVGRQCPHPWNIDELMTAHLFVEVHSYMFKIIRQPTTLGAVSEHTWFIVILGLCVIMTVKAAPVDDINTGSDKEGTSQMLLII
jgi:hypothetical protein